MASQKRAPAWGGGLVVPPALQITSIGSARRVWNAQSKATTGSLVFTIMGGAFIAPSIVAYALYDIEHAGPFFALGIVGVILLIFGAFNMLRLSRGAKAVVEYDRGFAALVGSRASVWPWSEVTAIVTNERMASSKHGSYGIHDYEVRGHAGQNLSLLGDELEDIQSLIQRIKSQVGPLLLRPLQTAYDAGETLTFGVVKVSREGINANGQNAPWSAVANVAVKDGRLIVTRRAGGEFKVRVTKIPNIEQLAVLIGLESSNLDLMYF